jgi:hypothetical protein
MDNYTRKADACDEQDVGDSYSENEYSIGSPIRISDDDRQTVNARLATSGSSPTCIVEDLWSKSELLHQTAIREPGSVLDDGIQTTNARLAARGTSSVHGMGELRDGSELLHLATHHASQTESISVCTTEELRNRTELVHEETTRDVMHREITPVYTTEGLRNRHGHAHDDFNTYDRTRHYDDALEYGSHGQQNFNIDGLKTVVRGREGVVEGQDDDNMGRVGSVCARTSTNDAGVLRSAHADDRIGLVKARTPVSDADVIFREQQQRLESLIRSEIEKTDDITYLKRRLAEVCPYVQFVCIYLELVCICIRHEIKKPDDRTYLRRRLADVCPCVQFVRMRVQSEIEKFDDRT